MTDILSYRAHRPVPPPQKPWLMLQTWSNLLFAHWPFPAKLLETLVPAELQIDTHEGQAWVSIAAFQGAYTLNGLTNLSQRRAFNQLVVRTYVRHGRRAGVYFFSLDVSDTWSVLMARKLYHLPGANAKVIIRPNDAGLSVESLRTHRQMPPAQFQAVFQPASLVDPARPGSLAHWLTERYSFFTHDASDQLYHCDIHHKPVPLQAARCDISINTVAEAAGITLPPVTPLFQYVKTLDVVVWPLAKV